MKFRLSRIMVVAIILAAMLFGYWILAPCSHYIPQLGDADTLPSPIAYIWPQDRVGLVCYYLRGAIFPRSDDKGIGVAIRGMDLLRLEFPPLNQVKNSEDLEPYIRAEQEHPLAERVVLYVDGKQVLSGKQVDNYSVLLVNLDTESGLAGGYYISWFPRILFGDHTARAVIETLSGEIIEYEWQFTITFP